MGTHIQTSETKSTVALLIFAVMLTALVSFILQHYHYSSNAQPDYWQIWTAIGAPLTALLLTLPLLYLQQRRKRGPPLAEQTDIQFGSDNSLSRLLLENSNDIILICDSDCTILYANPVTEKILAHPLKSLIGANAMEFINPEDQGILQRDMRLVTLGKTIPARELRLRHGSGDFIDVELQGFSLFPGKRKKHFIGAVVRDITSRKKQEQLLQVQEDWEHTFNTMADYVSVHDNSFTIIKANRSLCDFLGKKPEEILGRPCYEIFHNSSEPITDCPHYRVMETGTVITETIDDPAIGKPLSITCSPLTDKNGRIQGSVHIARIVERDVSADFQQGTVLPICASCKDIRTRKNVWMRIEEFFVHHYGVQFTHGVCQDCQKKLYPDFIND